jgi:uncharacterized protein YndB with AHSA1/START domain
MSTGAVIRVERSIPAAPDTVFRAITTPELFARWMGPSGSTTRVDEMDAVVGGVLAFTVSMPDGTESSLRGVYRQLEPPHRIVHTWADAGDGSTDVSTVTYELTSEGDGTKLVLTHVGVPPEDVERVDGGWGHVLDNLEAVLAAPRRTLDT